LGHSGFGRAAGPAHPPKTPSGAGRTAPSAAPGPAGRAPDPLRYCAVAPAATHAAITARSCSVMCVTLPSGIMRVTIVCW